MDQIKIQILYSINDFNDALYFTPEEFQKTTEAEIEAEKNRRYENYQNAIKNPPKPIEPTEEQLIEEAKNINDQIEQLANRKDEIAQIVDLPEEILANPLTDDEFIP